MVVGTSWVIPTLGRPGWVSSSGLAPVVVGTTVGPRVLTRLRRASSSRRRSLPVALAQTFHVGACLSPSRGEAPPFGWATHAQMKHSERPLVRGESSPRRSRGREPQKDERFRLLRIKVRNETWKSTVGTLWCTVQNCCTSPDPWWRGHVPVLPSKLRRPVLRAQGCPVLRAQGSPKRVRDGPATEETAPRPRFIHSITAGTDSWPKGPIAGPQACHGVTSSRTPWAK